MVARRQSSHACLILREEDRRHDTGALHALLESVVKRGGGQTRAPSVVLVPRRRVVRLADGQSDSELLEDEGDI